MKKRIAAVLVLLVLLAGCVYYPAGYYAPPAQPGVFERSWSAAVGAFEEQGVRITLEDRAAGVLRGARDGIEATANIRTQADGSVRVEFNASGATGRDPDLINRIIRAYDRRMGR
jgi:hypothetical protein